LAERGTLATPGPAQDTGSWKDFAAALLAHAAEAGAGAPHDAARLANTTLR
jgi:hypothetical protein